MAYDNYLGERIANTLKNKGVNYNEKHMFGGLAFMVDEKMCVGVIKDSMMVRIDPAIFESSLEKKGCQAMEFTGKPMKGFVSITTEGMDLDEELEYWIDLALDYNPRAKASKKKKKH